MKRKDYLVLPDVVPEGIALCLLPRDDRGFYLERTDRNIGWITPEEQDLLENSTIGIAGCGGMGGLTAATLLRLGVKEIRIADNENFDVSNLNRQFGATMATIGKSKAVETARMLRAIADDTTIVVYPEGINEKTADSFVDGCDIICDEIEFWAVGSRILLHKIMREKGSIILNSPTVGHRVYLTKFTPDSVTMEEALSMTYEEAVILQRKIALKEASVEEVKRVMNQMLNFAAPEIPEYSSDISVYSTVQRLSERFFHEGKASIIATNPPMASGFLSNQVLFHLLAKSSIRRNFELCPKMPAYLMFDAAHMTSTIAKFEIPW